MPVEIKELTIRVAVDPPASASRGGDEMDRTQPGNNDAHDPGPALLDGDAALLVAVGDDGTERAGGWGASQHQYSMGDIW